MLLTLLVVGAMIVSIVPLADATTSHRLTTVEGQLLVAEGDMFVGNSPAMVQVFLRTATGVLTLRTRAADIAHVLELSGERVRVTGTNGRHGLEISNLVRTGTPRDISRSRPTMQRTLRIAVVLMHLPGSRKETVSRREMQHQLFDGFDTPGTSARRCSQAACSRHSVTTWFAEGLAGRVSVSGRVFGYYDSSLPASDCSVGDWIREAAKAARRDGYSARYTNLVVYTPGQWCSFRGIAYVGSSGAYLNGNINQALVEHEMGHNLGLRDAGAYSCRAATTKCLSSYGDLADVMGNTFADHQFSAAHEDMLGWLTAPEVQTVRRGTRTLTLAASNDDAPTSGSTELIYVPRKDGSRYAIEHRESVGYDRGLSGVWIRFVRQVGSDDTELALRMPIAPGHSFVDAANDIRVTALADTGRTASVRVCVGECHVPPKTTTTVPVTTTSVSSGAAGGGVGLAANREIVWSACSSVVSLSDADLDAWRARGVGGFVCEIQHLAGLGGAQDFVADPSAPLNGARYELQRAMRDTHIVARAAARGIKMWIGIYLSNYYRSGPLEDWFDETAWSTILLPKLRDLSGAARMLGFTGLAFDEELYNGGSWNWNSAASTHEEHQVRAEARARGAQMMKTITTAFPGVDLIDYGTYFPDGWNALVQEQINHATHPYEPSVQINLWDGLTSVPGFASVRFMDATFYKTWHLYGATWDTALTYNVNRLMAYLSRHLSNWSYASTRVNVSPFAWIDGDVENEGPFTAPRDPAYVADQLAAFRRWGMGGAFSIYSYAPLGKFDYTPYSTAMRGASTPGIVDNRAPTVTIRSAVRSSTGTIVEGVATDNMAINSVHWRAGSKQGTAPMLWIVTSGDWKTGYHWHMSWTAVVPADAGRVITVSAYDGTAHTADASIVVR